MLQTVEDNEDLDHLYGTGWVADVNHPESDFKIPLFDFPYTNSVIKELGMFRTRVMRMPPKYCYLTYTQSLLARY